MDRSSHKKLRAAVVSKKTSGLRFSEDEKLHVAECRECMKAIVEALEVKRKTEGPHADSDPDRPAVKRALEHARRVFKREFGITLPTREGARRKAKAS